MIMKKRYATGILIITCGFSFQGYTQQPSPQDIKKTVLSTSVLEYIPFVWNAGNFNIGVEKYFSKQKSVYANIGLIKSYGASSGWLQLPSKSISGFKIQLEGRHYLNRNKIFDPAVLLFWPHIFQYNSQTIENSGYYVAVHTDLQQLNITREETYFPGDYSVDRTSVGMHFNIGYQCIKSFGLVVDYSIGLGAQYITSSSKNKLGSDTDKDWPWKKSIDDGSGIYPSIVYQVRIGWGL